MHRHMLLHVCSGTLTHTNASGLSHTLSLSFLFPSVAHTHTHTHTVLGPALNFFLSTSLYFSPNHLSFFGRWFTKPTVWQHTLPPAHTERLEGHVSLWLARALSRLSGALCCTPGAQWSFAEMKDRDTDRRFHVCLRDKVAIKQGCRREFHCQYLIY